MIDRLYHHIGLSLVIAWMILWPLTWFGLHIPFWGLIGAIGIGLILRETPVGHWMMAFLGHLSFALVLLIAAWFLAHIDRAFAPTPLWAKITYLMASLIFIFPSAALSILISMPCFINLGRGVF